MRQQPGGSTSPVGICRLRPAKVMDSRPVDLEHRRTAICTAPARRNSYRSRPTTQVQRWLCASTWSACSGTRSSPVCPSGSALRPTPGGPGRINISAFQNFSPGFAVDSR